MPIPLVQQDGYLIMWIIASTVQDSVNMLTKWGYDIVSFGNWIKISTYGRDWPSNGYFFQHCKETYLVAKKGRAPETFNPKMFEDAIYCGRGRQSHKPDKLYEVIEKMFPNAMYLEIFARAHNLRENWVSIGLEIPN